MRCSNYAIKDRNHPYKKYRGLIKVNEMNITMHNILEKQAKNAAIAERRDRIAIAAMQGSIASGETRFDLEELAEWSYAVADAMLKVRGEEK